MALFWRVLQFLLHLERSYFIVKKAKPIFRFRFNPFKADNSNYGQLAFKNMAIIICKVEGLKNVHNCRSNFFV